MGVSEAVGVRETKGEGVSEGRGVPVGRREGVSVGGGVGVFVGVGSGVEVKVGVIVSTISAVRVKAMLGLAPQAHRTRQTRLDKEIRITKNEPFAFIYKHCTIK